MGELSSRVHILRFQAKVEFWPYSVEHDRQHGVKIHRCIEARGATAHVLGGALEHSHVGVHNRRKSGALDLQYDLLPISQPATVDLGQGGGPQRADYVHMRKIRTPGGTKVLHENRFHG
ncbi:hypothetical protein SHO565_74410 [Streptomyces sp. HO565]